MIIPYYTT